MYKRTVSQADFEIHKIFGEDLKNSIKEAREVYEESIVCSDNPKKLYKYIRSSLSSKISIPLIKKEDGIVCQTDTAEVLVDTFSLLKI